MSQDVLMADGEIDKEESDCCDSLINDCIVYEEQD